jgi:hypothetical protein
MKVKFTATVCADCLQAIANDDYSGLDYFYNEAEAEAREKRIRKGIADLGRHVVTTDEYEEFSRDECACCDTRLAGGRHGIAVLE